MRSRWRSVLALCGIISLAPPTGAAAQESALRVVGPGREVRLLEASEERGYLAVRASGLAPLGWSVDHEEDRWLLRHGQEVLGLYPGEPSFRWGDRLLQLVDPAYALDGELWVPAQLLLDFLPFHLPDEYGYAVGPDGPELLVGGEANGPGPETPARPGPFVVVIDPGHGGRDLGAVGPGGTREKDVALALGRALAREMEGRAGFEVHVTRDSDELIPLWRRGEWATEVKGDRPGVFLSIHVNALPSRSTTRGFETYFLSEARTDHERRVAAIENAPADLPEEGRGGSDPDLGVILKELRSLDHQHWSALLAELVQARLDPVHPGPDRGVKQGPFAVITNALMPAVLVEVGFISNREEERLLGREAFHADVAKALADAVADFFERYPPESGRGSDDGGAAGAGR